MRTLLALLTEKKNRTALGFLGGGLVVLAGGAWVVVTYFYPQQGVNVSAGRDMTGNVITITGQPRP